MMDKQVTELCNLMDSEERRATLAGLTRVLEGERWECICAGMDIALNGEETTDGDSLCELWSDVMYITHWLGWEKFSGRTCYPVPDPSGERNAQDIFEDTVEDSDLFWSGAYGELRLELLNHLINVFEKSLAEVLACS